MSDKYGYGGMSEKEYNDWEDQFQKQKQQDMKQKQWKKEHGKSGIGRKYKEGSFGRSFISDYDDMTEDEYNDWENQYDQQEAMKKKQWQKEHQGKSGIGSRWGEYGFAPNDAQNLAYQDRRWTNKSIDRRNGMNNSLGGLYDDMMREEYGDSYSRVPDDVVQDDGYNDEFDEYGSAYGDGRLQGGYDYISPMLRGAYNHMMMYNPAYTMGAMAAPFFMMKPKF